MPVADSISLFDCFFALLGLALLAVTYRWKTAVTQVDGKYTELTALTGNGTFNGALAVGSASLGSTGDISWSGVLSGDAGAATVNLANNATTRTLQAKFQEILSVKDFGALGDGVTDDTAAIQAAINAASASSSPIVNIPVGTYLVTSTLTVPQHVRLQGQSAFYENFGATIGGSVIRLANGLGGTVTAVLSFTVSNTVVNPDLRHFGGIDTLAIDGRRSSGNTSIGINVTGCRFLTFDRLLVINCGSHGVFTGSSGGSVSADLLFRRCTVVYNGGHGFSWFASDSEIADCIIALNTLHGISGCGAALNITNCHIWYNTRGINISANIFNVLVSGCFIYDNYAEGLYLNDTVAQITVTGNVFDNNGMDTGLAAAQRCGIRCLGTTASTTGKAMGNSFFNRTGSSSSQQFGVSYLAGNSVAFFAYPEDNYFDSSTLAQGAINYENSADLVTLTAATTALTVGAIREIRLQSDSAVESARAFTLPAALPNQRLRLRWITSTNRGFLQRNSANVVLVDSWVPLSSGAVLELVGLSSTSWQELYRTTRVANTSGQVTLGQQAGGLMTGADCVAVGRSALAVSTTATRNVAVGTSAGGTSCITSSDNVFLGNGARINSDTHSGCIVIGSAATTSGTGQLCLGSATVPLNVSTDARTGGAAPALPAQPVTYLQIVWNGTVYYLPAYS
jgi:hypothetical protein